MHLLGLSTKANRDTWLTNEAQTSTLQLPVWLRARASLEHVFRMPPPDIVCPVQASVDNTDLAQQ